MCNNFGEGERNSERREEVTGRKGVKTGKGKKEGVKDREKGRVRKEREERKYKYKLKNVRGDLI